MPVDTLFDNFADGLSLDSILEEFPTLDRKDCVDLLETIADTMRCSGRIDPLDTGRRTTGASPKHVARRGER